MHTRLLKRGLSLLSVFAAVFVFCGTWLHLQVSADAAYYHAFNDYKDAGGSTATWNDIANAIDDVLEESYRLYEEGGQNGDYKGDGQWSAYELCRDSYNFWYETCGFERSVNGYSGSEVSKAELQFKTTRKAVKAGESLDDVKAKLSALSEILHIQANHLDGLGDTGASGLTFGAGGSDAPAETDAAASDDAQQTTAVTTVTAGSNAIPTSGGSNSAMHKGRKR